jgi:prevent-host-death family protein
MAGQITANDLKTKGIGAIEQVVTDGREVIITVRGKQKYVVLPIEEYNQLREFELDAAIQEANGTLQRAGIIQDPLKST